MADPAADVVRRMSAKYGSSRGSSGAFGDIANVLQQEAERNSIAAVEEYRERRNQREAFEQAFEMKIDPNGNEDVDLDEWTAALERMDIELGDDEIERLFTLIDLDESGYIDKTEFGQFLSQKWDAVELQQWQDAIISAMLTGGIHGRNRSENFNSEDAEQWDAMEMAMIERQMKKQVKDMVEQQEMIIQQQVQMENEIETMVLERRDGDPNFCNPERVLDWDELEVCGWLQDHHLADYMHMFNEARINGEMLLNDLDSGILTVELGVKHLHVNAMMREIAKLRSETGLNLVIEHLAYVEFVPEEKAVDQIAQLKKDIEKHINDKKQLKAVHEEQCREYERHIAGLQRLVDRAKQDGYLDSDSEDEFPEPDLFPPTRGRQHSDAGRSEASTFVHAPTTPKSEMADDLVATATTAMIEAESRDSGPLSPEQMEEAMSPLAPDSDDAPPALRDTSASMSTLSISSSLSRPTHIRRVTRTKLPKRGTKAYFKALGNRALEDETFCSPERLREWSHDEVLFWLYRINFPMYVDAFIEALIDGESLFADVDPQVLKDDLGVSAIHSKRLMREVRKLRAKCSPTSVTISSDWHYAPDVSFSQRLEELQRELEEAKTKLEGKEDIEDEVGDGAETSATKEPSALEIENIQLREELEQLNEKIQNGTAFENTEGYDEEDLLVPPEVHSFMVSVRALSGNDGFAEPSRAHEWNFKEVCLWLEEIGFPQYIPMFKRERIDGDMLTRDITREILVEDLQVKRLHIGRIMRQILSLRYKTRQSLQPSTPKHTSFNPEVNFKLRVEELEETELNLRNELEEAQLKIEELTNSVRLDPGQIVVAEEELKALQDKVEEYERMHKDLEEELERMKLEVEKANAIRSEREAEQQEEVALETFIEQIMIEKSTNPSFGNPRNVGNWSEKEVCLWLKQIEFEEYIPVFRNNRVDGDVLVTDMSRDVLVDLGLKPLHANKIQREIQHLKELSFGLEVSEFFDISFAPEKRAAEVLPELQAELDNLRTKLEESEGAHTLLSSEYEELKAKQPQLEEELESLQDQLAKAKDELSIVKTAQLDTMEEEARRQITDLTAAKEELEQQLEEIKGQYSSKTEEIQGELEQKVGEYEEKIEKLETRISELEEELEGQKEKLTSTEAELETVKEELEEQKAMKEQRIPQSYQEELQYKAEDDPTFGVAERAYEWSVDEVCWWLFQSNSDQYVDQFRENLVDGKLLMQDLSADDLRRVLKIKTVHTNKMMREINRLKKVAKLPMKELDIVVCESVTVDQDFRDREEIMRLREEMEVAGRTQMELEETIKNVSEELTSSQRYVQELEDRQVALTQQNEIHNATPGEAVPGGAVEPRVVINNEGFDERAKEMESHIEDLEERLEDVCASKIDLVKSLSEQIEDLKMIVLFYQSLEYPDTPFEQLQSLGNEIWTRLTGTTFDDYYS